MSSLRSALLAAASAAMFAPAALAAPDASVNALSLAGDGFVLTALSKDANEAKQSSRERYRSDRGARGADSRLDGDDDDDRGSGRGLGNWRSGDDYRGSGRDPGARRGGDDNRSGAGGDTRVPGEEDRRGAGWRGGDDDRSGAGDPGRHGPGGDTRVPGEDDRRGAGWRGGDDNRGTRGYRGGDNRGDWPGHDARRGDDNRESREYRHGDNRGSYGYRGGASHRPTHTPRPNYSPRRGGHSDWYSHHGRWTYYSGGRWNPWTETRYAPRPHWNYHTRYYSLGYNRHDYRYYDAGCRSSGNQVVAGALIGALFGGAVADDAGAGMLIGGLLGAGIGASLNDCDRGQYYYAAGYSFTHGSPYYWGNPYSGVRGVVIPRDYYNYRGMRCRYGDAEVFMPDGQVVYDTVRMCQDRYGRWQVARRQ